jgi:putative transposase
MRRLDEPLLDFPSPGRGCWTICFGARAPAIVGRWHVATLMKRMGIEAIYRRPNTRKPAPGHKICLYLLRGVIIVRPNHVCAMDICYIPMQRGFVYFAEVFDVASRRVLSHRVSITMEAAFCVKALEEALAKHGKPEHIQYGSGAPS